MTLSEKSQQKVNNLVTAIDNKIKTSSNVEIEKMLDSFFDEMKKE